MEEAVANARWLQSRREAAWAHGRQLRDHLLLQHRNRYQLEHSPPPALIARELITEEMGAKLRFDPMGQDRYAEVRLDHGEFIVTVNSEIETMPSVKDVVGVENVAIWHEAIHVNSHRDALLNPASVPLPGFEEPPSIVCYRFPRSGGRNDVAEREFWAEEAGRAAAVSLEALKRTDPFRELLTLGSRSGGLVRSGFPLLYEAAKEIGVNISALTTQLQLEGMIVIQERNGEREVYVQPSMV